MNYGTITSNGKTVWINNSTHCVAKFDLPEGEGTQSYPYFSPTGGVDLIPMFTPDNEINMPWLQEFSKKYPRSEYNDSDEKRAKYNNFLMAHLLELMSQMSNIYPEDLAIIFATYAFETMNPCRNPNMMRDLYAFEPMCGQGTVEELPKDVKDVHKDY
jgi:hypothetical protein